ncbi:hypothetical protein TRICI_000566 [Trichomonascus ciferrii]|uniref:Alpha-N-acetylglucosaminidase n=1 Tax=Trichomonascus ciferrii TaxID=44093 RepID=A0A642VD17_9ASCO|nr:hypothetical protein TRICI_000566 [Trichomonascus ciferrii]
MKLDWFRALSFYGLGWSFSTVSAIPVGAGENKESVDIDGLYKLVERQLSENLHGQIRFELEPSMDQDDSYDSYVVSQCGCGGPVTIQGASKSGLSSGLYRYLRDYGHVSISWTNSTLNQLSELPSLCNQDGECETLTGSSVVPYRYHFNTVTFSYTTPFYTWDDWQHLLDWASLQGVNLPLAWVGYEKILIEVLRDFGFSDEHLQRFLAGPAFQSWNRFGNMQGDWNATLSVLDINFIEDQFALQKQIIERMVELGMTPILPCFTGFVPREIEQVHPDAKVVNSSTWSGFPLKYTNVTFLEPENDLFTDMQVSFMNKQREYYGNVTKFYTLDQFNEVDPGFGEVEYLSQLSSDTIKTLKQAEPDAVWVMQGWLFYSSADFWTEERIEAYLSGPEKGELLILDLFSENMPIWDKTDSYFGHDWIWCQLHGYGGNMGLEGSLQIISNNFTEARKTSPSLVGAGLTMEGQEGNQIVYDALHYQAWHEDPYNVSDYTKAFIQSRYGPSEVPQEVLTLWDQLAHLVYTNDFWNEVNSTSKSILELEPALYGMEPPGHHSTRVFYDTSKLEEIWKKLVKFVDANPEWLNQPHFHYDMVDITRQVLANRFLHQYHDFVDAVNSTKDQSELFTKGNRLAITLGQLDDVLYTDNNFLLSKWISSARNMATENDPAVEDYFEFQARNQITFWGPHGEINNYASKSWAGLVGEYYKPIWQKFVKHIIQGNDPNDFPAAVDPFRIDWQWQKWSQPVGKYHTWTSTGTKGDLLSNLHKLVN